MPQMATEAPLMMPENPCQIQGLCQSTVIKGKGILQALQALCVVTRKCSSVASPVLEIMLPKSRRSEQGQKLNWRKYINLL